MKAETDFRTFFPKPLLTLLVLTKGLKIWLKTWALLLSRSMQNGIQTLYRLLVSGDWVVFSFSASVFNVPKDSHRVELRKASETESRHLALAFAFITGFKGNNLFKFHSCGNNPCRHDSLYTLKTKLL